MYIHLSINSNHPSIHLTPSIHLASHPSIHGSIHLSIHSSSNYSHPSIYPTIHPSLDLISCVSKMYLRYLSNKQLNTVRYYLKKKTNEEKHKARKRNYLFERKSDRYSRISIHTASIHERKYPAL